MTVFVSPLLRRTLLIDAIVSGATGLLLVAGGGLVERLTALPHALLFYAGLALLPYAALVAALGTRRALPQALVWAVIGANLACAAASIALLFTGWIAPNGLGQAFVIAQAIVVAGFGEVQFLALRRPAAAAV